MRTSDNPTLVRRAVAELAGTGALVTAVGAGIQVTGLSRDVGVHLGFIAAQLAGGVAGAVLIAVLHGAEPADSSNQ
ncbi:hypothetical protein GCM10020367_32000 [Streptomyces sannanensis]|uniref:Holin n=1 Tax=Streptomyces sannanensis TaxID=285536 RepID=A0ABP6SC62_9ACTN